VSEVKKSFAASLFKGDIGGMYRTANAGTGRMPKAAQVLRFFIGRHIDARYLTRVVPFPPLHWFWRNWSKPHTDAAFLHRAYIRALWRERNLWSRVKLIAHFVIMWPFAFVVTCLWATYNNGRAISRRESVPILRQLLGQLKAAACFGILPHNYYIFELFRAGQLAKGDQYLHRFEMKGGLFELMISRKEKAERVPMGNKIQFAAHCLKHNVSVPSDYFTYVAGSDPKQHILPDADIFIKPIDACGGVGAHAWTFADGFFVSINNDEKLSSDQLLQRLSDNNRSVLVQPRLSNHPAIRDLSNGALATVRMMTFANEHGAHEATTAGFRMAIGVNKLVDNVHAGGIIAAVDLKTGTLSQASDLGLRPDLGWVDRHPTTNGQITGRVLPYWQETIALACRAHDVFAPQLVFGWDIAITANGPIIVEGNVLPDTDILQRAHRAPLGGTRFAELVRYHLSRQPETRKLIGED
jgi:Sugar-transfer associated ATP-grasp